MCVARLLYFAIFVGRCGIDCGVGLSLQSPSLLRMMLARFLVTPHLAGFASIAGSKEKSYFHASKFVGVAMILRRIFRRAVAMSHGQPWEL